MTPVPAPLSSKVLGSFICRFVASAGNSAQVIGLDESTQESFSAECDISLLRQKGIKEGSEFRCTVAQKGDQTIADFVPLPPRELSEQELDDISTEVDSRLSI